MFDLECWLIGTPAEMDTAMAALATTGRIAGASKPEPLYGADAGRVRRYLRIAVPTATTTPNRTRSAPTPAAKPGGQAVIDLDSRRRTA